MPDVELDRILGWEVKWNVDCGVLNNADPSVLDLDPEILPGSGVFDARFQLVQDLDGSPLVVLDESGTPVEFLRHDAYGAFERVSLVPGQSSAQCESSAAQGCPSFYGNPIGYKG